MTLHDSCLALALNRKIIDLEVTAVDFILIKTGLLRVTLENERFIYALCVSTLFHVFTMKITFLS